eukprot:GFKZ01002439.1.p1 GENE.GFKZ01002439.1~~GFKZ01002439.1.p1  ORF type:complete len:312 (+),score=43.98 GFKZ01002439.1:122-1057(+)
MGTAPRELTSEEAALYDRQIRLWGLEAQRKLASSYVLLAGDLGSWLGHELAKNVLLSGVARLALNERKNSASGEARGFLGKTVQEMADTLREMNPLVDVQVLEGELEEVVPEYKVVCVVGMERKVELIVADVCREKGVTFMCGRVCGAVGWVFFDLGAEYVYQEKAKGGEGERGTREKQVSFCSYKEAVNSNWDGLGKSGPFGWHVASVLLEFEGRDGMLPGTEEDLTTLMGLYNRLCLERKSIKSNPDLVQEVGKSCKFELPPVAAIVGGMWGREIVKVVSGRDEPLNNFFFFNSATSAGTIERPGPLKS